MQNEPRSWRRSVEGRKWGREVAARMILREIDGHVEDHGGGDRQKGEKEAVLGTDKEEKEALLDKNESS